MQTIPVDASRKRSRSGAAAAAVAAHVLLIYLLIGLRLTHPKSNAPDVSPFVVSLIRQWREPPFPKPSRLSRPKLAMLQIALAEPIPQFRMPAPRVPVPSAGPIAHSAGSPARRGQIGHIGAPAALRIVHYVVPNYPPVAARFSEHGTIRLALRVSPSWGVDRVRILRSTGSVSLDRAAVWAVRQWTFAPITTLASWRPIWATVTIRFAVPQRLVGVPILIMPYDALPHEVDADLARSSERQLPSPPAAASVRGLLDKVIAAFPHASVLMRAADSQLAGDALELRLASLGSLRTVKFLGFIRHGVAGDADESAAGDLLPDETTHWEAYQVQQLRGASVWLVCATTDGEIRRIEVAID